MDGYCERHHQPWDIKCVNGQWVCECPKCRVEGLLDTFVDIKTETLPESCIYNKGRRLTDDESMGMLFDDAQEIPDGVIPIVHEYRDTDLTVKQCGNCLAQLFLVNQKYCAECGSRIKWEDVT